MAILVDYKDNYDTIKTTENKSMGFDLSAIQSCLKDCQWLISKFF